jgi:hypothetical protein
VWGGRLRWPQPDEWVVAHELADGVVTPKVAPTEDPTDKPDSPRMPSSELDAHREVGLIVKELKTVKRLLEVFEEDWSKTDLAAKEAKEVKKEIKEQKKLSAHSEVAEVAAR